MDSIHKLAIFLIWTLTIGQLTFDLAHWFFVIKYWNLSLKLKAFFAKENELKFNKISRILYFSYILFIIVLAAGF